VTAACPNAPIFALKRRSYWAVQGSPRIDASVSITDKIVGAVGVDLATNESAKNERVLVPIVGAGIAAMGKYDMGTSGILNQAVATSSWGGEIDRTCSSLLVGSGERVVAVR
jgi:hypothetical protein